MATNFLKFFSIDSDGVAFMVGNSGVLGWDCDAGEGSMWTELGGRGKLFYSSTASSVNNKGTASFFPHG